MVLFSAFSDMVVCLVKVISYPDAQAFFTAYRKAEVIVKKYKRDLAEWEQKVKEMENPSQKKPSDKPNNEQHDPPERESVRNQLHRLQNESSKSSRNKRRDYER